MSLPPDSTLTKLNTVIGKDQLTRLNAIWDRRRLHDRKVRQTVIVREVVAAGLDVVEHAPDATKPSDRGKEHVG